MLLFYSTIQHTQTLSLCPFTCTHKNTQNQGESFFCQAHSDHFDQPLNRQFHAVPWFVPCYKTKKDKNECVNQRKAKWAVIHQVRTEVGHRAWCPLVYTILNPTTSGVMGPDLTEIHKSSFFAPLFFFRRLSVWWLPVPPPPPWQQQPQQWPWRQQQQWQHTTSVVRSTTSGNASSTTRHTVL